MWFKPVFWRLMEFSHILVTVYLSMTLTVSLLLGDPWLLAFSIAALYLLLLGGTWL
jgi:hypothetical protein